MNPRPENPVGMPEWPGKTSTGGRNWLGYMASEFNETTTVVWNYAESGATTHNATVPARLVEYIDLPIQVERFNRTIGSRPAHAAWAPDNSVASIWLGMNDVVATWQWTNLSAVMPILTERLVEQAQVLHGMGLRNFLFVEIVGG